MKFLIFVFISLTTFLSIGQENLFMNNGYIGYSEIRPNFRKDMERLSNWQGVEVLFGDFAFAYYHGSLRNTMADSTIGNPDGKIFSIGYRVGHEFSVGGSSFFSASVKPFIQFAGNVAQVANIRTNSSPSSAGLTFSPGIDFRFSHIHLMVKYDAGLYLGTTFWAGNNNFNAVKGYLGGLSFSIGIENAFDLLNPQLFTFGGLRTTIKKSQRTKEGLETINGELYNVRTTVTTTVTDYSPGEVILSDLKPFFGVGPTYSFKSHSKRQAPTVMKGANLGFRYGYWMIDGYYEEGQIGLADQVGKEGILTTFPQLRNYDFSSQINAKRYGGRIGFNLSKLVATSNFVTTEGNQKLMNRIVPFTRFSVFYTVGITDFDVSNINYTFAGADEKLSHYQKVKSIVPSANNNPNYLQKSLHTGWGLSIEAGSAFMNYTWYKPKDAEAGHQTNFTVGANIPIGRITTSIWVKHLYRQMTKRAKKD